VAGEWALLVQNQGPANSRKDARGRPPQETGEKQPQETGEKHRDDAVAPRLAGGIGKAGRRSEFAAAMLKARAWVLADPG